MIDHRILDYFKTTNQRLREIFTNPDIESQDYKSAEKIKDMLKSWIQENTDWSVKNYHHFAATDIVWDGQPIGKENIPLMLYAQKKLNIEQLETQLKDLDAADQFIETGKNEEGEEIKSLNVARLTEVTINIGRSLLNRRVAAQSNKYNNLYPFFKYETRSKDGVSKLRAEVMSQYSEIMVDGFGYRHLQTQFTREMLQYGYSVAFPSCAWLEETQAEMDFIAEDGTEDDGFIEEEVPTQNEFDGEISTTKVRKPRMKTVVTKEGVPMTSIHPTRVIYDRQYPLSSINTDTGCSYVGFWDIKKYRDIKKNPNFFNRDSITISSRYGSFATGNDGFFSYYFNQGEIDFPSIGKRAPSESIDPAENDRAQGSTLYSKDNEDNSIWLTDIRVKLVPSECGLGEYSHPLWCRFIVASDDTIVFAEWLPSLPAIHFGHNQADNRLLSLSMVHDIMPFQDQLSNIMSQLLLVMKHNLVRVVVMNTDVIDDDTIEAIEASFKGEKYYQTPKMLKVSLSKMKQLNLDIQKSVFEIVQPNDHNNYVNDAFRAIVQILSIVERLLVLSPQEQGQPAPREISATEVNAIENSTSSVFNSISDSIDEARAAWKKIVYESSMAEASDQVTLPASQRYKKETIEKAGFKILNEDDYEHEEGLQRNKDYTVIGSKRHLIHDFVFSSRDGSERPANNIVAQTLVQLLGQAVQIIGPEQLGKTRIFEIMNEVFRLLGVYDLRLDLKEDEAEDLGANETKNAINQLAQAVQQTQVENADQQEQLATVAESLTQLGETISQILDPQTPEGDGLREGEVAPGVTGSPPPPVQPITANEVTLPEPTQEI